jgi:hypothetical protein
VRADMEGGNNDDPLSPPTLTTRKGTVVIDRQRFG